MSNPDRTTEDEWRALMERTWNEILLLIHVQHQVRTDAEWDEAKMDAIENTIEAIISKLSRLLPDPS